MYVKYLPNISHINLTHKKYVVREDGQELRPKHVEAIIKKHCATSWY